MSVIDNRYFPIQSSTRLMTGMRAQFDTLQQQLATGEKHASLAELGSERHFDLTIRARMARIEGYGNTITAVSLRIDAMASSLSRLDAIAGEARGTMSVGGYGQGNINLATAPGQAAARLDEVMNLLNGEMAGRYLFGGNAVDGKPVASASAVLDGEAGKAGFRTVASERKLADLGTNGMGRLTATATGTSVTVAEDGAHPFGFKLATLTASPAQAGLTQPSGDPASLAIDLVSQPASGTRYTIGLDLPDGTSTEVSVTAGGSGVGSFAIGTTPADTAANMAAAIGTALSGAATRDLSVASSFAAAEMFFSGQGEARMRIDGPPFETAMALRPATSGDTVQWYRGQDSADPRSSVSARIDDAATVGYGVQANEAGIAGLVRTLAVMATETYPDSDLTSRDRFDAVARRQVSELSQTTANAPGSLQAITVEISLARTRIERVSSQQSAYAEQLESLRAGIEGIATEQVAAEILALKTRLEASYQTTALVSQLSLVNYL